MIALLAALALLLGGVASGDEAVVVTAEVDRSTITIGDPIRLSLVIEAPAGYQVTPPGIASELGDLEVLETLPVQQLPRAAGGVVLRFGYRVTAFRLGDHEVPPIEVAYSDEVGVQRTVRTAAIAIQVASVMGPADDPTQIRPLKPQLEVPGGLGARAMLLAAAAGAVLAAIGALFFWRSLRRRAAGPAPAPLSPAARAIAEMQRIAGLRLPDDGRYREHYELLAATLRRYLVEQFGLPALERTARELRVEMERAAVDRRQAAAIFEILRESEVVRFQRAEPYPRHAQQAVLTAVEVLRKAARGPDAETVAVLRT